MNESRQRRLLEGQSSTARKLYEFVPRHEAWVEGDIAKAAHNGHVRVGLHTIRACLGDMKDAGLVKETQRHYFQRVAVTKTKKPAKNDNQPSANEADMPKESAVSATSAPVAVPPVPAVSADSAKSAPSSLELLAGVSTELTTLGVEFIGRIKALATRVDEVALQVEAQREADNASMAKVRQMQALMKDVMGGQ
jgi:hypothetical protein